ncbi:MAG TPA: pilus assembly protein PilP [Gammaproteobacteria bacterium]|nr:pilus assembly protein PilP [Gammaproteobacteria bacterium]
MKIQPTVKLISGGLLLPVVLLSAGCVSRGITSEPDLNSWRDEVLARPGGRIEPLPEIKPYEAYAYMSGKEGKADPFESFYQVRVTEIEVNENVGLTEEMEKQLRDRNREELEKYELDSLKMVGLMENEGVTWGIIRDPDGNVSKVKVGDYMGRNVGKIVNIFEDRIELREIVRNSQGRWEEREAAIALAGEE